MLENQLEYCSTGVAEYILKLFPKNFYGICIDVGAYLPMWNSNSYLLEQHYWDVFCIEPNPHCIPELTKHRKHVYEVACGNTNKDNVPFYIYDSQTMGQASGTGLIELSEYHKSQIKVKLSEITLVQQRTLQYLVDYIFDIDHIDFLTIDTEKTEFIVLEGLDFSKNSPFVISVENIRNSSVLPNYLIKHGYRKIYRIGVDDIFMLETYYTSNSVVENGTLKYMHSDEE